MIYFLTFFSIFLSTSQLHANDIYLPEQMTQEFIESEECEGCEPSPISLPMILKDNEDTGIDGIIPPRPWFPRPKNPKEPESPENPKEPNPENPPKDPFKPDNPDSGKDPAPDQRDEVDTSTWLDNISQSISDWFGDVFNGKILRSLKQMITLLIWTVPGALVLVIFLLFGDILLGRTASMLKNLRKLTDAWKYFWKKEDE